MKKFLVLMVAACMMSCSPKREVVEIYKGDPGQDGKDGTSCSVMPEVSSGESLSVIGARISCTDGSYSVILNGAMGSQGVQGPQGEQGVQGPVGQTGAAAEACQVYRVGFLGVTFLTCPNQWPVAIYDGKDGEDGKDGVGCASERQESQNRVRITCGTGFHKTTTYVYDGEKGDKGDKGATGAAGASCTATQASGGAYVKCGNGTPVFIANGATGPAGTQGPKGEPGRDGLDGEDGADGEDAIQPGLSCNVHNLANWDGVTNILTVLAASAPVGSFTLPNLSVGNSPSANGFPGMPAALQSLVGLEGYALDCNGYLNIKTSGYYNFSMLSDDGVRLMIDNQVVINNPGLHAPTTNTKTNLELQRGQRPFNVIYYQGPHTQIALQLGYSGPNATTPVVIPSTEFTH